MTTKYELVKEIDINGSVAFFTKKNGTYVPKSVSLYEDEAKKFYDIIVKRGSLDSVFEVIQTIEVNENE